MIEGLRDQYRGDTDAMRDAMLRLDAAISNAKAELNAGLSEFRADAPDLESLFDDEGEDDGTP